MQVPSQDAPHWMVVFSLLAVPCAGAVGALLSKLHTESATKRLALQTADDVKQMKKEIEGATVLLAEHTGLHQGYVSMQNDVRATRDCVIRIAERLKVDGPR